MESRELPLVPLAEQLAERIAERIRDGRYTGRLPGYRVLCREFAAPRGVVLRALGLLAEKNICRPGGSRRRGELARTPPTAKAQAGSRGRVLLLSMDAESDPHVMLSRNLPVWKRAMEAAGLAVQVAYLDAVHARRPRREWADLITRHRPGRLLLISPSAMVATWAAATGLRTICLGGVVPETIAVDVLGVSARAMVRVAVDELITRGRRDICMPLGGRIPAFAESMRAQLKEQLASHGLTYVERLQAPGCAEADAGIFRDLVEGRLRERVPTGILVFDPHELACIQEVLAARGIRVPDRVSIILLSELPQADWWAPGGGPARFHFDEDRRARRLVQRLLEPVSAPTVREVIEPRFVAGGTLAPAG